MNDTTTHHTIVIQGISTRYIRAGSGPALILVHGWAQSAATWKPVISELAKEYTVYALDLPGFGRSACPRAPWTTQSYGDFVREFAETLSIGPCSIVGHSFGARVAAEAAVSLRASHAVFVSMSDTVRPSLFRSLNTLLVRTMGAVAPQALYRAHRTLLTPAPYADTSDIDIQHARFMLATYIATHTPGHQQIYSSITCPTLLIYGKNDPITPQRIGSRIQSYIAGSTVVVIPDAGHLVHIEKPSEFLEAVLEFLRG